MLDGDLHHHHPCRYFLPCPHQGVPHVFPQTELWDQCWLHAEPLEAQEKACDGEALWKH
jgi:hypothetical protein